MQTFDINEYKARRARLGYSYAAPVVKMDLVRRINKRPVIKIAPAEPVPTELPIVRKINPRINSIIQIVCEEFGIDKYQLIGPRRYNRFVIPRHIACYLMYELTDHSLPRIAYYMGGRDHTTILNSFRRAQIIIEKYPEIKDSVDRLKAALSPEVGE